MSVSLAEHRLGGLRWMARTARRSARWGSTYGGNWPRWPKPGRRCRGTGRGPLLWHTNHGRYLSGADPEADGTSAARGETLDALGVPAEDPDPSWFLEVLTGPPPGGVRSDPGPGGRGLTTLCTLVADLTAGEAVIAPRGEPPVAIPLADLAEGNPRPVQF